jgi:hypothetical protein
MRRRYLQLALRCFALVAALFPALFALGGRPWMLIRPLCVAGVLLDEASQSGEHVHVAGTVQNTFVISVDPKRLQNFIRRHPSVEFTTSHGFVLSGVRPADPWFERFKYFGHDKPVGEAGVFAAHVALWRHALTLPYDWIFVFEDDARVDSTVQSIQVPSGTDVMVLTDQISETLPGTAGQRRVMGGYGTVGYVFAKRAAQRMIDEVTTSREPIDIALIDASCNLRIYVANSRLAWVVRGEPSSKREISLRGYS